MCFLFYCVLCVNKTFAGHLSRLLQAHYLKYGRCNIGKATIAHVCFLILSHVDKGNWIKRVGCVRSAIAIDGMVAVAMIGYDNHLITCCSSCLNSVAHAIINSCNSLLNSAIYTSVAHHVTVGIVDNKPMASTSLSFTS